MTTETHRTATIHHTTEVGVADRFDAHQVERFADDLRKATGHVVLDLGRTRFIDSFGLHALVEARATAIERGADLAIGRISQTARITLELAGLTEALPVIEMVEAA